MSCRYRTPALCLALTLSAVATSSAQTTQNKEQERLNPRGVHALLNNNVKLGGEASAAAGPKGRQVGASTDLSMLAEILSYSRSRGLFAGVSLEGAWLRPDDDGSEQVYGRRLSARDIILGTTVEVPASGRTLVDLLQQRAPRNLSGPNAQ